jgi:hypothetical protein
VEKYQKVKMHKIMQNKNADNRLRIWRYTNYPQHKNKKTAKNIVMHRLIHKIHIYPHNFQSLIHPVKPNKCFVEKGKNDEKTKKSPKPIDKR